MQGTFAGLPFVSLSVCLLSITADLFGLFLCPLSQSAQVTITKYHRLDGLKTNLFSHGFGAWKSKMKVPTDLVSSEAFLHGLQTATA